MNTDNKTILTRANEFVTNGDNEGFLNFCTDDVIWEFVGDRTLEGKEAVREYMKANYIEPPQFNVEQLIAEGEMVTAIGTIRMKNESGAMVNYAYCDVWRFRDGKMASLKAFVVGVD
ncbi:nuclear transport factor 2 family protein [Mucilaginibacter pedocola]|uniref:Ketosteroid isomerase n=1 Tax=Mucilaginibacter pedocola TaxID=1792845 RepID=A0A1S9PIU8_9SPHI|nr:nuclear transport factor 2 family protein [Mucilaginibacter pedocola]OOQ60865.1 ketosteroid isomerase [Mucilaginibacter pedocola]